jgi:hypothetical protein
MHLTLALGMFVSRQTSFDVIPTLFAWISIQYLTSRDTSKSCYVLAILVQWVLYESAKQIWSYIVQGMMARKKWLYMFNTDAFFLNILNQWLNP